jgi:hypothetical protein
MASFYVLDEDMGLDPFDGAWSELCIQNSHSETEIEIWATAYGGIRFLWLVRNLADGREFHSNDRLFDSRGNALDDACDFIQEILINSPDAD